MAETTQFRYSLQEVAIALVKSHGLHEGKWMIGVEFNFGAANAGPTQEEIRPAAFAAVGSIILSRQPDDAPDFPLVIDAAKVNPKA